MGVMAGTAAGGSRRGPPIPPLAPLWIAEPGGLRLWGGEALRAPAGGRSRQRTAVAGPEVPARGSAFASARLSRGETHNLRSSSARRKTPGCCPLLCSQRTCQALLERHPVPLMSLVATNCGCSHHLPGTPKGNHSDISAALASTGELYWAGLDGQCQAESFLCGADIYCLLPASQTLGRVWRWEEDERARSALVGLTA
ncbi:uncharacterized protein LOC111757203 isoform X2 [Cavia porcellus]|uniref:uncharacterized protein LOC111757203 isoform X2 n=1 Tax=Cavia porcellus TaxID=10141 RepID=UPI002FDF2BF7